MTPEQKEKTFRVIDLAIALGELRTRAQMLEIHADNDGRIRCGYNVVGTETGRLTCYTSPSGSGYNLTTVPDENPLKEKSDPLRQGMRDLILADPDCFLLKCDLKGADGWTVGAWLNKLGDPTMLDDLNFGIKPAQVLCFMLRHGPTPLQNKSRPETLSLLKEVKKDDWDYFACKQCIWGFCYLMGPRKASTHVFNLSEGKVNMTESEFRELQRLLFARYQIKLWHNHMTNFLARQSYPPKLTAASGLTRKFFGRPAEILGEALSHEPQANTTFATNSAALRLWNDPTNYNGTHLIVEPIHQVHDELLMQCKQTDLEFAKVKVTEWFDNPMVIAGQRITIPAEGSYGTNWAMDGKSKVGSL